MNFGEYTKFGPFGAQLNRRIAPLVKKLAPGPDDLSGPEIAAVIEEIRETADALLQEYSTEFVRALSGWLAFHGGNSIALGNEPRQAVQAMAENALDLMTQMVSEAVQNASNWVLRDHDDIGEIVVTLTDLDQWTETVGEHSLDDLFFPQKERMDA